MSFITQYLRDIADAIEADGDKHKGIAVVAIDGYGLCVENIDSQKEPAELVDKLYLLVSTIEKAA